MSRISPTLPVVGGDIDVWGDENNGVHTTHIAQTNDHDDRIVTLEGVRSTSDVRLTALEGTVRALTGGTVSGVIVALDDDGTPYFTTTSPSTAGAYLTEDAQRFLIESGSLLLLESS